MANRQCGSVRSAAAEGLEACQMSEFPETEEKAARFFGFDKGVNDSMLITKESKNGKKTRMERKH
jgi:hypothetical protein